MEELELLKRDWNKRADSFPKLSETDIYAMLHKKSSSVVKWILLISIIEFAILLSLTLLLNDAGSKQVDSYLPPTVVKIMSVGDFIIMLFFMLMFYINYRKISATDKVKNLMANILRTRKTVSTYIIVKISFIITCLAIMFWAYFTHDPQVIEILRESEQNGKSFKVYFIYISLTIGFISAFVFCMWIIYKIIYGLLLKRLRKNYDELKKIDM